MTLRFGAALLATALATLPGAAAAQYTMPAYREDPGTALNRHLKALSEQPRSVLSLSGAGRAALELGDPQAALTFFARAEEVAPRDGRIKAGLGSALLQMEQAEAALKFFGEAAALGAPPSEYAKDRGLAYDIIGDPRRAQADYALVLARGEDDEVRRRMALSLAISGQRDPALKMLDPQLRRQDRAAWRTRAFVLALSGDANGATQATQAVMPHQAAAMRPFFARLPALNPAQRAMAVHFGHFPGDGQPVQMAQLPPQQYASAAPVASQPRASTTQSAPFTANQAQVRLRTVAPAPVSTAPRRRPGANEYAQYEERIGPGSRAQLRRRTVTSQPAQPQRQQTTALAQARPTIQPAPAQPQRQQPTALAQARPTLPPAIQPRPAINPAPSSLAPQRPVTTPPQANAAPPARQQPVAPPAAQFTKPVSIAAAPAAQLRSTQGAPVPAKPVPAAPTSGQEPASQPRVTAPAQVAAAPEQRPFQPQPESTAVSAAVDAASPVSAAPQEKLPFGPPTPAPKPGFADLAASINALPDPAPAPSARVEPKPAPVQLAQAETPAPKPPVKETKADAPSKEEPKPAPDAKEADAKAAAAKTAELAKAEAKKAEAAKAADAKKKADLAKAAEAKKKADLAKAAEAKKKAEAAKPKEPSRIWVQVAGGADKAALPYEFGRIKAKAPKLLTGRSGWTTPLKATNRVLVGPFKSDKEAQEFVNQLAKEGITGFSWTSPEGQEIAKLAAR